MALWRLPRPDFHRLVDTDFQDTPLALRPGDSLTIPRMALSVGFIHFVSSLDATQATELLTVTLVGLTPTKYVSLCWTHSFANSAAQNSRSILHLTNTGPSTLGIWNYTSC